MRIHRPGITASKQLDLQCLDVSRSAKPKLAGLVSTRSWTSRLFISGIVFRGRFI